MFGVLTFTPRRSCCRMRTSPALEVFVIVEQWNQIPHRLGAVFHHGFDLKKNREFFFSKNLSKLFNECVNYVCPPSFTARLSLSPLDVPQRGRT
jgi:hypothetical protein